MDVDREKKVMKKLDDITCWLNANPSANKEEIDLKRKDLELTAIQHTVIFYLENFLVRTFI